MDARRGGASGASGNLSEGPGARTEGKGRKGRGGQILLFSARCTGSEGQERRKKPYTARRTGKWFTILSLLQGGGRPGKEEKAIHRAKRRDFVDFFQPAAGEWKVRTVPNLLSAEGREGAGRADGVAG